MDHEVNTGHAVNGSIRLVGWEKPEQLDSAGAEGRRQLLAAAREADRPGEPASSPRPDGERVLGWLALADEAGAGGTPVGLAELRLPEDGDLRHAAELELCVHPEHRGRNVGRRLLEEAVAAARALGRTELLAEAGPETAGARLLTALDFEPVLRMAALRLAVDQLDAAGLREIVRAGSPGYRLARWPGVVPPDLAEAYAAARSAMDERPMRGLVRGTAAWDAERLHRFAEVVRERGDALLTVAGLYDGPDAESVAGFSEVAIPGAQTAGRPLRADQPAGQAWTYTTAVVPEHRGHGLGLWLKAAMLQWLTGAHPEITEVWTECAEENRHMLAVNERLGFRAARRFVAYRLGLDPGRG